MQQVFLLLFQMAHKYLYLESDNILAHEFCNAAKRCH